MEPTTGPEEWAFTEPGGPLVEALEVVRSVTPEVTTEGTSDARQNTAVSGTPEDTKVLRKRAQWVKRQRAKRERDKKAQGQQPQAGNDSPPQTLEAYVRELAEIAAALREGVVQPDGTHKELSSGMRATYRLRANIIGKLIVAMEKLEKEKKSSRPPAKPPWPLERVG